MSASKIMKSIDDSSEYFLMHVSGDLEGKSDTPLIKHLACIPQLEIHTHLEHIREFTGTTTLVRLVQLNIVDLLDTAKYLILEYAEKGEMSASFMRESNLQLTRQILNILTAFRSFLDHSDCVISRSFGKNSGEFLDWKNVQSVQYDSSSAYRIVYRLRNYCQHVGTPPLHTNFVNDRQSGKRSLELNLNREILLAEKTAWNAQTRDDLNNLEEVFSAFDLFSEWERCFQVLARHVVGAARKRALPHAQALLDYRSNYGISAGFGNLATMPSPTLSDNNDRMRLSLSWLPEDDAAEIVNLDIDTAPLFGLILNMP